MVIDGISAKESVRVKAYGDVSSMILYCPVDAGTQCSLDCTENIGANECQDVHVYTDLGIGMDLELRLPSCPQF